MRTPDCNDRRVVRNKLTPAGRDMIERPWEARRAVLASALRHAAPHERAAIEHGLALLCGALERSDGVASEGAPVDWRDRREQKEPKEEKKGRNTR